ncbi:hypothetical protein RvY_01734 [Ramazzottius varieornatus]|uniref:Uncharacterized protein n=1 Tax=Ramazzottius varieornatus TaxID=947166 RepID=A0A1D1UKS9_RAMVA|nr:hypothetical protein RvY_01734 [Ramazzottius varieornatus]
MFRRGSAPCAGLKEYSTKQTNVTEGPKLHLKFILPTTSKMENGELSEGTSRGRSRGRCSDKSKLSTGFSGRTAKPRRLRNPRVKSRTLEIFGRVKLETLELAGAHELHHGTIDSCSIYYRERERRNGPRICKPGFPGYQSFFVGFPLVTYDPPHPPTHSFAI